MLRNFVRLKRRRPMATENHTRIQPAYVSPYISTNSGETLPVSNAGIRFRPSSVSNDDRQGYHQTSSLAQKMIHQHTSSALTDSQPYTGVYNQAPTPEATSVQSFIQSGSYFSHDCQVLNFCINAPTVTNATPFYTDTSAFVVLHQPPLPPSPSSELQQHFPIPSSSFANDGNKLFPAVCQDGYQTPNHLLNDPEASFLSGSSSASSASSSIIPQRALGTSNVDPVPERDHDSAINQPIVNAVPSLREDQWPPDERMYTTVHTNLCPDTGQYPTNFPYGPTQYDPDSLATTFETPYAQSPSPIPDTNASHPAVSPPSSGSLADCFTSKRSCQWQYVASAESSPEIQTIEASPARTAVQQNRTTNATVSKELNFCHLCCVSFTQPQVFRRHLKDKHEDKEVCTHCSGFEWSRGRPYLYRRHLKLKHPHLMSFEDRVDRPGRTRKFQASVARRCKVSK